MLVVFFDKDDRDAASAIERLQQKLELQSVDDKIETAAVGKLAVQRKRQ